MPREFIKIRGARQNNLKGIDVDLPLGELIVITGVSGSGKSSLAFDTIYSEGQRRYVETFSPYARQFLDRMDKPAADRIDGIPPAIAIDQTNPVRTSRSTVGTMTELNDHLKLLFARAGQLHCLGCARAVRSDSAQAIRDALLGEVGRQTAQSDDSPQNISDNSPENSLENSPRLLVTFPIAVPASFSDAEVVSLLAKQGYPRTLARSEHGIEVIQDRLRVRAHDGGRLVEALEAALKFGRGRVDVRWLDATGKPAPAARYSSTLHCSHCDISYREPIPSMFSFNSPVGACPTCRGFGRTIGIDYGLVIPDEGMSLAEGAIKPWQSKSYRRCQRDLLRFARERGVPIDAPWRRLGQTHRRWVIEGEGRERDGVWYGAKRFFAWLETKSYRMHIRVLLSKYRSYAPCPDCEGARLKPESLGWRIGDETAIAAATSARSARSGRSAPALPFSRQRSGPRGLSIHEVMLLPIERCRAFFEGLTLPAPLDEATDLLLGDIRSRLRYLTDVGLGYLTLDRQSRTLSGGEVQRINLTTALGTSLVNTLFVLDEPTIGMHARDIQRVIGVLHRLRDAGNTLIVVEHDRDIMLAADRILDLGPGPGSQGGQIVFFGSPRQLARSRRSVTAKYLRSLGSLGSLNGAKGVKGGARGGESAPGESSPKPPRRWLRILGARANNLKDVDVAIPLNRFVCVTGVSGSGKSTLVEDVCHRAMRRHLGRSTEPPGEHRGLRGQQHIADVVLVDQAAIGKTTRSNPASYVGALAPIRKLFAAEPLARERGYTAGTFSFNTGTGRCPTCTGSGFEHVEMQFLSDVYLRCPDCDGRRFRPEILEVTLLVPNAENRADPGSTAPLARARSIADVLDMTVAEAAAFFAGAPEVGRALEPLAAVGLGYLSLGQPVPTLSGGEAQRLKLAGHLAKRRSGAGIGNSNGDSVLFLFDEPTTGLHFEDIETLLGALRKLVAGGHTVLVIEHSIDVIAAADWVIDLGPEGGDDGGEVLCAGSPRDIASCPDSYTGAALRADFAAPDMRPDIRLDPADSGRHDGRRKSVVTPSRRRGTENGTIRIHNAREHNLKNANIEIPRDRFTVITGVSGSGKSTVAFDILFAEGQRRYLESLNAYARQFVQPGARPDVDAIYGIPPTVAIEQRTSRGGRKSTVATMTELYHFLRLLYVKLGVQNCPDCDIPIEAQTPDAVLGRLARQYRGHLVTLLAPLVVARKGYYTDLATWAAARGYSRLRVDGEFLSTASWPRLDRFKEHDIELPIGEIVVAPEAEAALRELLTRALDHGKGRIVVTRDGAASIAVRFRSGTANRAPAESLYSVRRACPRCERSFDELDPRLFSFNSKHGWCPKCYGTGLRLEGFDEAQTGEERWWTDGWEGPEPTCPACAGHRLRAEALAVHFHGRRIHEMTALSVSAARRQVGRLTLSGRDAAVARDILSELTARLDFLEQVGLGYLTLDRAAPTLSGGEAQRIRLASQLGSNLRGVCYILDEPTIGLHARDNQMLLETLRGLERKGNTIVVVEHDEETIRQAAHVVDLGPGAGVHGGRVIAEGSPAALLDNSDSVTGRFLANPLPHPLIDRRERGAGNGRFQGSDHPIRALRIERASRHNLKGIAVEVPLGRLVCVTGVSGSGKSTLVRDVIHDNLAGLVGSRRRRRTRPEVVHGCTDITGWEVIDRVMEVDQTPIGKTPRSCPATYVGFWDRIRRMFAETPESRMRGYAPGRFSFNVAGGRCDACEGQGVKKVEMSFLPDVKVTCDACRGARFAPETLSVRFKGKTIAEVLEMSVDESVTFFAAHPPIHRALRLLHDVGLGYLTLGQPSPTLSGGEAQRIKLVTELARVSEVPPRRGDATRQHVLYVLDEPTIGLHMADVERLIRVLHRLVGEDNTVIVIEHHLDIIAEADWIIDLGPEGGDGGGRVVAKGSPAQVARSTRRSYTGRFLATFLKERRRAPAPPSAGDWPPIR